MKFYSTIFCLLFLLSISKGQFVFTAANSNPIPGDNYIEYYADTTGVNSGPAGANQIWDFHFLNINTSSSIFHSYINPIPFFFASCRFPGANFNSATIEDSVPNSYFYADNNCLTYLGNTNCSGLKYTNDTLCIYPFSYGSSSHNNNYHQANCCLPQDGGAFLKRTYDAYGTLILPGIIYTNVARIEEIDQHSASYGQGRAETGHTYTYKWYVNGIKFPILTISLEQDSTNIGDPLDIWIYGPILKNVIVQNYNGVGIDDLTLNENILSIHPNPSNGKFMINSNITNGELYIYNVLGEKIYFQKNENEESEIDLSKQPNGIYFLQMKTEQGISTRKIVINK
jgi:hypothetical protein